MGNCGASSAPAVVENNTGKDVQTGRPETLKTVKSESSKSDLNTVNPPVQTGGVIDERRAQQESVPNAATGRASEVVDRTDNSATSSDPNPSTPSTITEPTVATNSPRIRFAPEVNTNVRVSDNSFSQRDDLSSRPLPVTPFVLKQDKKGMLKIVQTKRFAAYSLPSPGSNSPFPRGFAQQSPAARPGTMNRQPSRKATYLRNTLKKLSMMDMSMYGNMEDTATTTPVGATSPSPTPNRNSALSPGNRLGSNAHLLSLESTADMRLCDVCQNSQQKGVSCLCNHFLCTECFCTRVSDLSAQPDLLRKHDFAIFCPVPGCKSLPWNSYHVRKLLDGPSLQRYLDALVAVCLQGGSNSSSGGNAKEGTAQPSPNKRASVAVVSAEHKYLVETAEVLRDQLRRLNVTPIEYIPLPEIQAELQGIFEKLNNDQPYDEKRMDYLLMCMESNPVYRAEKEELARQWRADMAKFTTECLTTMRGYVPAHIAEATLQTLQEKDGLNLELAKRLLSKKCLWLVRMRVVDIERIHEVDLMGRFNPIAQGLDIVELAAIYASVPEVFCHDPTGRKAQWRLNLENALREMDKQRQTGGLPGAKARHPCYKKQTVAPFMHRLTMKRVEFVQSSLHNE